MTTLQRELAGLTRHQRHLLKTNLYFRVGRLGRVRSLRLIAGRHGEDI